MNSSAAPQRGALLPNHTTSAPQAPPESRDTAFGVSVTDWLYSFFFSSVILVLFLMLGSALEHWFIIPVFCCGVLIGTEPVRVARGRLDPFTAEALVGVVGYHMFFIAPLLHVYWDHWMPWIIAPEDWRPWLGRLAILNLFGIGFYLTAKHWFPIRKYASFQRSAWHLNVRAFSKTLIVMLFASGLLQIVVYAKFGGISGYIHAFETQSSQFAGLGTLFIVSESFPMLALIGYVVWATRHKTTVSWSTIVLVLAMFILLRLLFGGLRGSRGSIVWAVFWALGLIHIQIRPIPRKAILIAATVGFIFMYLFAFYKDVGSSFFTDLESPGGVSRLQEDTGRSMETLILGDFSRADVQAFLLYQLSADGGRLKYDYLHGQTYLAALYLILPAHLVPLDFTSKQDAGTYVLQAGSVSILGDLKESRVYGIAGEAILNFGWSAVPIAYALFGIIVGAARRWQLSLMPGDSRLLLVPLVTVLAFYPLVWDLDNVVVFAIQFGLMPILLVIFSSRRVAN